MGPGKTTSFTVGDRDQEMDGLSGSVHVNPVWNGAELDMQPSNGTSMKRYLEGDWRFLTQALMRRKFWPDAQPFGSGRSGRVKRNSKLGGSCGDDDEVEGPRSRVLEEFATTAVVERERVDGEQAVARDAES